jgi:mono/diheme cytochrome c family protein
VLSADLLNRYDRHWTASLKTARSIFLFVIPALILMELSGCHHLPPSKPLSELTPRESAGRQVFLDHCARCHYPDSERGLRGPGLLGLFRQPYLPSGVAANDQRVTELILRGRGMMPALGDRISERQLEDLMAYLHTL